MAIGEQPISAERTYFAQPVAQGATTTVAALKVPGFDGGVVTGATFTPNQTITGATTNTRRFSVINTKQDGTGTTVVASIQFNNGNNAPAMMAKQLVLAAAAADLRIAKGDVLAFRSEAIGLGIVDNGGILHVQFNNQ